MSQSYTQSTPHDAMDGIITGIKAFLKVAFLARVVKYDKKKHIADIVPLANSFSGEVSAQLLDVPVSRNCYEMDEYLDKVKSDYKILDNNPKIGTSLLTTLSPKPAMRKGAVVIAVVMDKDHDNWTDSGNFNPNTKRLHDINDSIIVGVM